VGGRFRFGSLPGRQKKNERGGRGDYPSLLLIHFWKKRNRGREGRRKTIRRRGSFQNLFMGKKMRGRGERETETRIIICFYLTTWEKAISGNEKKEGGKRFSLFSSFLGGVVGKRRKEGKRSVPPLVFF